MLKFAFMMALFMTIQEVQSQRSPYAGSARANRFRSQPVNIVPASSLQSTEISPLTSTHGRSIDLTTILTTISTTQQPQKLTTNPEISLAGRISNEFISNRNQDQYRDYDYDHHRHGHTYRGEHNYNYNDFY